jgi:tetratricopeptide (TPR) repeat protein
MITMDEVYGWLNRGDVSHLSAANRLSLIQIEDKKIPANHRQANMRAMRTACETSRDILETLEVKLALSKISYADGDYPAAKIDIQDAVERYKPSSHRLGVAKWMAGILLWRINENDSAYSYWTSAKEIFLGLAVARLRAHDIDMVNWYHAKVDDMRSELALTAEEANYWLNFFEKSHLSAAGLLFAGEMRKKVQKKDFPLAYEIGLNLAKISHNRIDTDETAEAWVLIGLAALQMGNPRQAVDYFQRGAAAFGPRGHKQAVTRWMMGIAQWQIPGEIDQAVKNWVNSIDAFEGLHQQADRDNDQKRKEWYEMTIATMKKAQDAKISGK